MNEGLIEMLITYEILMITLIIYIFRNEWTCKLLNEIEEKVNDFCVMEISDGGMSVEEDRRFVEEAFDCIPNYYKVFINILKWSKIHYIKETNKKIIALQKEFQVENPRGILS